MFIHIFIVWLVLNLDFVLPYVYKVHTWGNYLWKPDGTATTVWEYFLLLDYYRPNVYYFLFKLFVFIPLVELNYWFFFQKNLLLKAITFSFIAGVLVAIADQLPWSKIRFENYPLGILELTLEYGGYALIYGMVRKYLYDRAYQKEMQLQRSENELNALKAQLNPHFFFNSLNYLYGTALNEKAAKTADAISILSEMMRYTVSGMKENFVTIGEELKFIKSYLTLQRARLPEKDSIVIEYKIVSDNDDEKIAPLLLLSFIENAFKYGISIDHPCHINLNIKVHNGKLDMALTNRIIHEHDEIKGNNTGINNTRKRLELLYENKYTLHCADEGGEYKVLLSLLLT